jgi:formylglycine-generating enzyme required for sulfatase activity
MERGEQRIDVTLSPELGEIAITAAPADAELYIDGAAVGNANRTITLPTRPHAIEVRRDGYASYATTVTPRPGVKQVLDARLVTLAQARQASIRTEIQSPGGQVLKLQRPGAFTMGASRREAGRRANEILREVKLQRPFYIAVKEVTNAEFRRFDPRHRSGSVQAKTLDGDPQPVVNVSWVQAAAYCNWLSAKEGLKPFYVIAGGAITGYDRGATGYRLPTEAEWEWVARVAAASPLRKYPWGDAFPPPAGGGNFADESATDLVGRVIDKYRDGYAVTAPTGSFAANERGLYDLAGNAAEWAHDAYDVNGGSDGATPADPLGPASGDLHAIRGSSWAHGSVTELRLTYRDYGNAPRNDLGFRIARYLE